MQHRYDAESFSARSRPCDQMRLLAAGVGFLMVLFCPCPAYPEIVVYDGITLKGEEFMLRAETRGKVFSKGGEVVEFSVDGRPAGKRLSGGDGFAFLSFTPRRAGIYRIQGKTSQDEGKGLLLSVQKGSRIVFVDVESSLMEGLLSRTPRKDSSKALEMIAKKFPVICLQTGFAGIAELKRWLTASGFPDMPVLSWKEGEIFAETREKGLRIHAVIASDPVLASARKYRPKPFSFQDAEDAETVDGWDEIARKLLTPKETKGDR